MAGARQVDSINFKKIHRGKEAKFPFFYSFINKDDTFDDGGAGADVNNPRYIPIPANTRKEIPIKLDDDSIWRIHYIRYNVGRDSDNELGPTPTFPAGVFPPLSSVPQNAYFLRNVDVSMFAESSGARELISPGNGRLHMGNQGGMAYVRHPFLYPRSGLVNVKFNNRNGFAIRLDGFLFGYKVQF